MYIGHFDLACILVICITCGIILLFSVADSSIHISSRMVPSLCIMSSMCVNCFRSRNCQISLRWVFLLHMSIILQAPSFRLPLLFCLTFIPLASIHNFRLYSHVCCCGAINSVISVASGLLSIFACSFNLLMAPFIIFLIWPLSCRHITSVINLSVLIRSSMESCPNPPISSCIYSTSLLTCCGILIFALITVCIFVFSLFISKLLVFAYVSGYSICLYTTAFSTCSVPPAVILRDLSAFILLFTFSSIFFCSDPSYIVNFCILLSPFAFCIFPR